ncbi:uncharacterized protein LOC114929962 [Nylanderia fulva]|uniref:uncharacterized protein LOC114929962 n=1 Tax=Nylanderia fulva TaxID=613905 RepID=UPI0010FB5FE8|nr:uncharacterized protein LOC114929962 [Nylanderia fulva]
MTYASSCERKILVSGAILARNHRLRAFSLGPTTAVRGILRATGRADLRTVTARVRGMRKRERVRDRKRAHTRGVSMGAAQEFYGTLVVRGPAGNFLQLCVNRRPYKSQREKGNNVTKEVQFDHLFI